MEENDFVSLWKQPKLLLIYRSLLSMSAIPHYQVCQLSQNVCHMCLVYGYISNTWHTVVHENSSIYGFQQRHELSHLHS